MTATEVVAAGRISGVWAALGGDPPKSGRERAFFRDGNNSSAVSLNDSKGCWFDHRNGVGGGVLDLIQHIRGCDRGSALRWLAEFNGVPLEDQHLSAAERREYARRAHLARQEATELLQWKQSLLDGLKRERDRWWAVYHATLRHVLTFGLDTPLGDPAATLHELAEGQVEVCIRRIDEFAAATFPSLLPVFRETKARAAA